MKFYWGCWFVLLMVILAVSMLCLVFGFCLSEARRKKIERENARGCDNMEYVANVCDVWRTCKKVLKEGEQNDR